MAVLSLRLPQETHVEKVNFVVREALKEAGETLDSIDAIAVTYGPGLVGALLVGVAEAESTRVCKRRNHW